MVRQVGEGGFASARPGEVTRLIIIGAGAVGGVLAGGLARAGRSVAVVARGAHGRAIRARGLTVVGPGGAVTVPLRCVERIAELPPATGDLFVLAVKSQDTAGVIADLPAGVPVICAQNGVTNEPMVAGITDRVYGMMVWLPGLHLEPGVVEAYAEPAGLLRLGCWPAGRDATAGAVSAALAAAGFDCAVVDDIARWKWGKLLTNLGNALDAYFAPEVARARDREVVTEGRLVLEAAGVDYLDPRGIDRAGLAATHYRHDPARRRGGGSSWQSVIRGQPTEIAHLNGTIVDLARRHGVAAPLNQALLAIARDPPAQPRSLPAERLPAERLPAD